MALDHELLNGAGPTQHGICCAVPWWWTPRQGSTMPQLALLEIPIMQEPVHPLRVLCCRFLALHDVAAAALVPAIFHGGSIHTGWYPPSHPVQVRCSSSASAIMKAPKRMRLEPLFLLLLLTEQPQR